MANKVKHHPWKRCSIHRDVNGNTMWGCPDCLAYLRRKLRDIGSGICLCPDTCPMCSPMRYAREALRE